MVRPRARPYSPTPRTSARARIGDAFNQVSADIGGRPLTAISRSTISGRGEDMAEAARMSRAAIESLSKKRKKRKPAPPVKDAAAEKRAKIKEEGRKRRIKFEKKQGEKAKKRRALLLNIERAKNDTD